MNGIFYSLLPHLNRNQKLLDENVQFKMKILHFEPLDIDCIPKKQIQMQIERKLSPLPNFDTNSVFLNRLKLQKMFHRRGKQSISIKSQNESEPDYQSYIKKLKPQTLTLPLTSRNEKSKEITQKIKNHKLNSSIEENKRSQSKIKCRLPKIKKNSVMVENHFSLNSWTNNSSSSLLNSFQ